MSALCLLIDVAFITSMPPMGCGKKNVRTKSAVVKRLFMFKNI